MIKSIEFNVLCKVRSHNQILGHSFNNTKFILHKSNKKKRLLSVQHSAMECLLSNIKVHFIFRRSETHCLHKKLTNHDRSDFCIVTKKFNCCVLL